MSTTRTGLLAVALLLGAQPAWCLSFSLGAHLGLSTIRSHASGTGTSTVLAWPSNAFTYQPALRIAVGDARRTHEVLVDSGLFLIDQAGSTLSLTVASVSYQYTLAAERPTATYANLGLGRYWERSAARVAASASYGGGLGLRRAVADRHGALRAELRMDRLDSEGALGRPLLTTIGLRLGFDLWL